MNKIARYLDPDFEIGPSLCSYEGSGPPGFGGDGGSGTGGGGTDDHDAQPGVGPGNLGDDTTGPAPGDPNPGGTGGQPGGTAATSGSAPGGGAGDSPLPTHTPGPPVGEDAWNEFKEVDLGIADLLLEQHEINMGLARPIASDIVDWMKNTPERQIAEAQGKAGQAVTAAWGTQTRNRDRYGIQQGWRARHLGNRMMNQAGAANRIQAANIARQGAVDLEDAAMQDYIAIGHGVQGTGLGGLVQAAGLQANRQANSQIAQIGLESAKLQAQYANANRPSSGAAFLGGLLGGL